MDPKIVGREPKILIGPYSGTSGIAYWIKTRLGIEISKDSDLVKKVYMRIIDLYNNGARDPLNDKEIEEIVIQEIKDSGIR
jgi:isopropylmalate/homocitrate/citramalate synthase